MSSKSRLKYLYRKLKEESISREEYEEFLSMSNDRLYEEYLDEVLGEELEHRFPKQAKVIEIKRSGRSWRMAGGIAAAVSILVAAFALFFISSEQEHLVFTTSDGETRKIELPDRSNVVLNANSELVWLDSRDDIRTVKISGEAFFDVRHQDKIPFRVHSNKMIIEVLGTSFNVNNRGKKDEVFLEEGSIRLNNPKDEKDMLLLRAGESAYYNDSDNKLIKTTDLHFAEKAEWKDGMLKYHNLPAYAILEEMEQLYGVKLILNDEVLRQKPMDFNWPYADWESVGKALALALGTTLESREGYYEFKKEKKK